jgi:ATP-binding cassette, subfamily B, bacterial
VTPVRVVSEWTVGLQTALASAARIGELIDAAPERREPQAARPATAALAAAGLVFAYPARSRSSVLDGIDLQLRRGDVALLRGPVGSGKSTLLRLLAGRRVPARGTISLGGAPVHRDHLRRSVLLLEQAPHVLGTTVRANLGLGRPGAHPDELLEAAELVDAAEFIVALPEGLETTLGDRGATLSGGQRQRLALARAVLAGPDVLLLDAATSDLDPEREAAILGRVAERWRDGILVVVSANPAAGAIATTTIEVRDGLAEVLR